MFCSMKWGIGNSNEMGNGSDLGPSANINKHQTHIGFNHEMVQILCWYKFSIMLTQPLCKKQRQEGSRQIFYVDINLSEISFPLCFTCILENENCHHLRDLVLTRVWSLSLVLLFGLLVVFSHISQVSSYDTLLL